MNNIDKQYTDLLQDILDNGVKKETRNGGTISVFGRQIRHDMKTGFPILTTKKMAFKTMVTELLWFLRGDTNIKYLVDNNCHIWDGDAYQKYFNHFAGYEDIPSKEWFIDEIKNNDEFAKKWGSLGKIYGHGWRNWGGYEYKNMARATHDTITYKTYHERGIDQIANLISELKKNPDSRRLLVSAWNVEDVENGSMVLPPCHYGFQVYTREMSIKERVEIFERSGYVKNLDPLDYVPTRAISLMYNTRSQDVPLGTPFNIASYALLLEIIAKEVNMVPDELIANMGDCHIYLNQIEGVKEQLTREPYKLPRVKLSDRDVNDISEYTLDDIILENYQSHPSIKMPLSN
jgi:thymidylate synthase